MEKKKRNHVVISGTGRAGTTFLVKLLTKLGFDTGFNENNMVVDDKANAGLELDIRNDGAPYIVKSPWFCDYVDEVIKRDDIKIDYLIVPIRDVKAAAKSRTTVYKKHSLFKRLTTKPSYIHGGMWGALTQKKQEIVLLEKFFNLLNGVASTQIPIVLLKYPLLTKDPKYLFKKLQPLMNEIPFSRFEKVFKETVRPELVHNYTSEDK